MSSDAVRRLLAERKGLRERVAELERQHLEIDELYSTVEREMEESHARTRQVLADLVEATERTVETLVRRGGYKGLDPASMLTHALSAARELLAAGEES
jgi:hypothetical protein